MSDQAAEHDQAAVNEAMRAVDETLPTLSGAPKVDEFQTELALDANGEPAAFITVVVEDSSSGDPYPWTVLKPIYDLIWRVFLERVVPRRPFIDFRLRSEMGGMVDDDAAAPSA
jgi:hypothetical protein